MIEKCHLSRRTAINAGYYRLTIIWKRCHNFFMYRSVFSKLK
uniref:Uncharacterized protein n=1 Tax=Schistosoma mansoni TaxID=6183 RepID=A0A5K4F9S2_SCHMA